MYALGFCRQTSKTKTNSYKEIQKIKDSKQSFQKRYFSRNIPGKFRIDEGTKYWGIFEKICKEKDFEVYSTMSKTKAAFA